MQNGELSLELFKLAVENAFDHIFITDKSGTVIYVNRAGEKITGYSREEMIGQKPSLWGGEMPLNFYKHMWQKIAIEKKPFSHVITNKRKNGTEYPAHLEISPIINGTGEVKNFVAIERDITHEKQVDKAKTEFVSFASHQLRGPMTAINIASEMLLNPVMKLTPQEKKEYLRSIHHSNHRMLDLVNNLLDISKIEMGTFTVEPKKINMKTLVNSIIEEQAHIAKEKNINIEFKCSPSRCTLTTDEGLTRIVIQNILSNALKYTPEKGSVVITLHPKTESKKICPLKEGSLITIADTGYGIPAKDHQHIFDKMYRSRNVQRKKTDGLGLGLYMVKNIIERLGGMIWLTSKINKGTTFYILFPNHQK